MHLPAQHLAEWALWMSAAGMSLRTIHSRLRLVDQLSEHADGQAGTLTWQPIAAFLGRGISQGTRSTYYADLRAYYRWLVIMDHRTDDPTAKLHRPRAPRRIPRPITTDQLRKLLGSISRHRTLTMVLLAAYQGLRAHEIAAMRGELIRGGVLRVIGKGAVDADLPLHPIIEEQAGRYARIGWWFPAYADEGREGLSVHPKTVTATVSRAMRVAGVPGSCHSLRHWYGTHALRAAGGNLRVAQELLRHSSPATTAGYTQVDDEERRAALHALPTVLYLA